MLPEGSQQWQQTIFIGATLFLIYQVWRGWRLGAVRGLLRLTALCCAWVGGSAAAGATGTLVAFFSKVPPFLAPAVAGLSVGLGIYIVISLLAGLLFKTTKDHEGVVRIGFGIGGALCGVIYGFLLLVGGIMLIRGLGAVSVMRVVQAHSEGRSSQSEQLALTLIKLKSSLELGATGERLKSADPLPTAFYDDIVKISMITGNPQAIQRFVQYPPTLKLIYNPKVATLLQDPALTNAAQTHNFLPLLQNKHLQEVAEDPVVIAELKAFDLTAALNYALTQPGAAIQMQPGKYRQPVSPNSPLPPGHGTTAPSATP